MWLCITTDDATVAALLDVIVAALDCTPAVAIMSLRPVAVTMTRRNP